MKPRDREIDARLWGLVTATVRPLRGRARPGPQPAKATASPAIPPAPPSATASAVASPSSVAGPTVAPMPLPAARPSPRQPQPIEPGRRRRLDRGRDQPAASVDLHGLNQDQARAALTSFILRGWAENRRILLVITGKGALGDGVLRRRTPEWLAEPPLRQVIAGISEAHRRHGGEGALYVVLKRPIAR